MKIAIRSSLLFLLTAIAAHGHTTGLAHSHPHSGSASTLSLLAAIAIGGGLFWFGFQRFRKPN